MAFLASVGAQRSEDTLYGVQEALQYSTQVASRRASHEKKKTNFFAYFESNTNHYLLYAIVGSHISADNYFTWITWVYCGSFITILCRVIKKITAKVVSTTSCCSDISGGATGQVGIGILID